MAQVGSKNHKAKLTEEVVRLIRRRRYNNPKESREFVARLFSVSRATIWRIDKRQLWKHVI